MKHQQIIDSELVEMYYAKVPLEEIMFHFGAAHSTIYEHLRKSGVKLNRQRALGWTDIEDYQLIEAYMSRCTGQTLCDRVPTRTLDGIKGRLSKHRRVKGGVVR